MPTKEAAEGFGEIRRQTTLPLVADIHFDYRMALLSIEKGADKIRINLAYAARATVWSDLWVILATLRRLCWGSNGRALRRSWGRPPLPSDQALYPHDTIVRIDCDALPHHGSYGSLPSQHERTHRGEVLACEMPEPRREPHAIDR